MTSDANRLAYLEAMDIDVWRERGAEEIVDAPGTVGRTTDDEADIPLLDWDQLRQHVAACQSCGLHEGRTQTVFGVGDPNADWLFVGEAPGQQEDLRGEPFVGRAGQLLDQMLLAIGLDRETVFIANVLKCRPPNNRDPAKHEAEACRHYLERQIQLINPKIVVAVGRVAAHLLLDSDAALGRLRGRPHSLNNGALPLVVTYHPAYLLRTPSQKANAWQDLRLAHSIVNEKSS